MIPIELYLIFSFIIFSLGCVGVTLKRSITTSLISIQMMFLSSIFCILSFSKWYSSYDGIYAAITMAMLSISMFISGTALAVSIYKTGKGKKLDDMKALKG